MDAYDQFCDAVALGFSSYEDLQQFRRNVLLGEAGFCVNCEEPANEKQDGEWICEECMEEELDNQPRTDAPKQP